MDAGRLRRETGSLCHSFHGLTRVMENTVIPAKAGIQMIKYYLRKWGNIIVMSAQLLR
jgi:hypothetical protein